MWLIIDGCVRVVVDSSQSSRTSPMLVEIDRIIDRSIRESRAIDVEALCILVGRKVWSIRVDIHVLDDVGNVIDAAVLATVRREALT